MLFYREALRREARASAERLADVNAGMAGGRFASDRLRDLLAADQEGATA